MTALEACEKIEGAIDDLHEETANSEWELSYTKPNTDQEHIEDYRGAIAKTRAHFELGETSEAWFVTTESNATLAWCGNSPTAPARARYIAWVNPKNITLLIARLRELEDAALKQNI